MKRFLLLCMAVPALILAAGCNREEPQSEVTTLKIGLPGNVTRTHLGASEAGARKVYWSNGDQVALNGTASNPLSGLGAEEASATFTFPGIINAPYSLLYPASFYTDASHITLPATQAYAEGTIADNVAPLAGYATDPSGISLGHLCTILQFSVKKDPSVSASNLITLKFKGGNGEQVCGLFSIDYPAVTLTGAGSGAELTLNVNQPLNESTALDLFLVVPAGTYSNGFTVEMEDASGRTMTKIKKGSTTLTAGKLAKLSAFTFKPSPETTEFTIEDVTEEVLPLDGYNITGRVVDTGSNPIPNVVVSDGLKCVQTMSDGTFYMESDLSDVKFVYISTPSGYLPEVVEGIPHFYKAKDDIAPSGGIYDFGDFVLTPVANPNRFTLLITADPQPRANNWGLDKVAYQSLQICEDLYDELADVASGISGRQVYGICLGDLVHENMSLFNDYATGLAKLGYPTYNVIGNHDNDTSASTDDEGAAPYESHFGPRNYSFNIGGIHFVVLDNLIMKLNPDNGNKLTSYDQGLTDRIWTWLQADMSYIPTTSTVMVCAHSPMFKQQSGSERTNTAYHAGTRSDKDGGAFGYGDLFDKYAEVHAWAGHTHSGFNFVYASNHRHKNVQVHTLARSTGELYTNEYLANGTPRGFTIVEVDNGAITWKFHPTTRQSAAFQGETTGYCSAGAPAYTWRDWSYSGGVAVMNGGGALTEEYQLHAYPRGAYVDNYVYANVFLWDEQWQTPVWTPAGGSPVEMTRINTADNHSVITDTDKLYDLADTEFRTWYKLHADKSGGSLKAYSDYKTVDDDKITTLFRAPASASPSSGTVSVTDRFGNTYSRTVSW